MQIQTQHFRALLAGAMLVFVAPGFTQTSTAPPLHTLTCNQFSTTPGAIGAVDFYKYVNTYAPGNPGNPGSINGKSYWEGAVETTAATADGTTGVLSPTSANGYNPPDDLPAQMASGWIPMDDQTLTGMTDTSKIGFVGNSKPNRNANVMYYFRYRFNIDAQADPAKFILVFPAPRVDDFLKGLYVNGRLVQKANDPSNIESKVPVATLPADKANWIAGTNEVVLAILNAGAPAVGKSPHEVSVSLSGGGRSDCTVLPSIEPPTVPGATIYPSTAMSYAGKVTNWHVVSSVSISVIRQADEEEMGPYPAELDPQTGAYRITNAPKLPEGVYIARATFTAPQLGGSQPPVQIQSQPMRFEVAATLPPVPLSPKAVPGLGHAALVLLSLMCAWLVASRLRRK